MRAKFAIKIMKTVQHFATILHDAKKPPDKREIAELFIIDAAKCLFYMFYHIKMEKEESDCLLDCIKYVSESISNFSNPSSQVRGL